MFAQDNASLFHFPQELSLVAVFSPLLVWAGIKFRVVGLLKLYVGPFGCATLLENLGSR